MVKKELIIIIFLTSACINLVAQEVTRTQLAGKPLQNYPYFQYVQSINENASVYVAIDPSISNYR